MCRCTFHVSPYSEKKKTLGIITSSKKRLNLFDDIMSQMVPPEVVIIEGGVKYI